MSAGGKQFDQPSFEDANPKKAQPNEGGMAQVYYTDENTWSGADERVARMDQNSTVAPDLRLRGYHVDPVGGTYNPGQGKGGRVSVRADQMGAMEKAPGSTYP